MLELILGGVMTLILKAFFPIAQEEFFEINQYI